MREAVDIPDGRSPAALGRADVRRCGTLWVARIEGQNATSPAPNGVRIRVATESDIEPLRHAMIAAGADNPRLAEVRLTHGRLGLLAEDTATGAVLSYGWIARPGDTVNDLGFPMDLPQGEVWVYDCATVPAAQGRGLYPAVLTAMRVELARRKVRHAWIGTAPRNWPSQRGIAHAGFEKASDMDWTASRAIVYGAPGMPAELLRMIASATGDAGATIHPDRGIPWITGEIETVTGARDDVPPELRQFQWTYGEQIHWRMRRGAQSDEALPRVTLAASGRTRNLSGPVSFQDYAAALDDLAPGLPLLSGATDAVDGAAPTW